MNGEATSYARLARVDEAIEAERYADALEGLDRALELDPGVTSSAD